MLQPPGSVAPRHTEREGEGNKDLWSVSDGSRKISGERSGECETIWKLAKKDEIVFVILDWTGIMPGWELEDWVGCIPSFRGNGSFLESFRLLKDNFGILQHGPNFPIIWGRTITIIIWWNCSSIERECGRLCLFLTRIGITSVLTLWEESTTFLLDSLFVLCLNKYCWGWLQQENGGNMSQSLRDKCRQEFVVLYYRKLSLS